MKNTVIILFALAAFFFSLVACQSDSRIVTTKSIEYRNNEYLASVYTAEGPVITRPIGWVRDMKLSAGKKFTIPEPCSTPDSLTTTVCFASQLDENETAFDLYEVIAKPTDEFIHCFVYQVVVSDTLYPIGTKLVFYPQYGPNGEVSQWKLPNFRKK